MPLYDYDCATCGRRFEILRGVHAADPTECPLCGGGPVKKAFATPAIHFKGSGWAKKERRATPSPGSSKAADDGGNAAASAGSDTEPSPGGKGDSKDGDSAAAATPAAGSVGGDASTGPSKAKSSTATKSERTKADR